MTDSREYAGIDYFRVIAALLVVAIHISPLENINETADFILTRIIGRVAVPFFFMTSGFFIFSDIQNDKAKIKSFINKTISLYIISIIIYIPVNIYAGYFKGNNLLSKILRDILINGTMYHLWYLPAAILGGIITWVLMAKIGHKRAFYVALCMYLVGLFGDSYFGVIENTSILARFYDYIFKISDYTRNGLFFAPIFFILGSIIKNQRADYSRGSNFIALLISLSLMLAEGLLLHKFQLQRHDSMYITLVPCMFFLFRFLLSYRGNRVAYLGTGTMIVYIIHPMMIIFVRLLGKVFGLESLLVEDKFIHYILVLVFSTIVALILTLWKKGRRIRGKNNGELQR